MIAATATAGRLRAARRHLLATSLACLAVAAEAGRPLSTEDASVLEDKRCQLEAWVDRTRSHESHFWAAPACNFGGGIEWQAGAERTRSRGDSEFSAAYAQAKGLFREIDDRSAWGLGWVVGVNRDPLRETRPGWSDPYAVVPLSVQVGESLMHFNLGWSRDRAAQRDVVTWGAAVESPVSERLTFVAEAFGEDSRRPFVRIGGRFSVVKEVLEVDLTYVTRPGGGRDDRYLSLGVFVQSARFLP